MTPTRKPPAMPLSPPAALALPVVLAAIAPAVLAPHLAMAQPVLSASIRSTVKPPLPVPAVDPNAGPASFLIAARAAVERARFGEAQEALERAETRLLQGSAPVATAASFPDRQRIVSDITVAHRATIARDWPAALAAIDDALAALQSPSPVAPLPAAAAPVPLRSAAGPVPLAPYAGSPYGLAAPLAPPPLPRGPPSETYGLLPGHWQLEGARYVWVPPDSRLRRVVDTATVPNRYVWRGGRWVFEPQHTVVP